jgi:hypothetical protein
MKSRFLIITLIVFAGKVYSAWDVHSICARNTVPYSDRYMDIKNNISIVTFDSCTTVSDGYKKYTLSWRLTWFPVRPGTSMNRSNAIPMITGLHCWENREKTISDLLASEPSKMMYEGAFEDVIFLSVALENTNNLGTWWWGTLVNGKPVSWVEDAIVELVRKRSQDACLLLAHHGVTAVDKKQVDINRLYLVGHSMGGTGVYHIGIKYPDLFAAIHAHAGFADFKGPCGDFCTMFYDGMIGKAEAALKVKGRDGKLYPAIDYTDMSWFIGIHKGNSVNTLSNLNVFAPPYIIMTHGKKDRAVSIESVNRLQTALENNNYGYSYFRHGGEHSDDNFIRWNYLCNFRLNESYLAFNDNSTNGGNAYEVFNNLDSVKWYPSSIIDSADHYAVTLSGAGTVNVTLRRCQKFKVTPGEKVFYWVGNDKSKGSMMVISESGIVSGIPVVIRGDTRLSLIRSGYIGGSK